MFWNIVYLIISISVLIYLYYLRLFFIGLRNRKEPADTFKKKVSVIVAARNEEKNISKLLTSLVNQHYPEHLFEIIIADDGSEDSTATIIEQFAKKWENIKLIKVTNRKEVDSPKKNALSQAIEASSGDIILSTDADCIVGKYWISSIIANLKRSDMVTGFSRTMIKDWKKSTLLHKFEHFDFVSMFAAAAGAISSGKYFSCSGQNIAYKKKSFLKVGGFEKIKHLISGDDVNLMQLFRKTGMKVSFSFSPHSFAYTVPCKSWSQFLSQRSRWSSNIKWQTSLNPEFFFYLICVFFIMILPIVLIFKVWWFGLGIILLRAILEIEFLKLAFSIFCEDKKRLLFYPAWLIIQPVYFVLIAFMGVMNFFRWKE